MCVWLHQVCYCQYICEADELWSCIFIVITEDVSFWRWDKSVAQWHVHLHHTSALGKVIFKSLKVPAVTNLHQHAPNYLFLFSRLFFLHTNYQIKAYPFPVYPVLLYAFLMEKKKYFLLEKNRRKKEKKTFLWENKSICVSVKYWLAVY